MLPGFSDVLAVCKEHIRPDDTAGPIAWEAFRKHTVTLDKLEKRARSNVITRSQFLRALREVLGVQDLRACFKAFQEGVALARTLQDAIAGDDANVLARAIEAARGVPFLRRCVHVGTRRLQGLRTADAHAARRAALGISALPMPGDMCCPITLCKMLEPVVASDGHSYERVAIERVLAGTRVSPMTRAPLSPTLWPNHALRARIDAYEDEMVACAEAARAHACAPCAPRVVSQPASPP